MILQALKEYYDRKAADPDSGIAPPGWEWKSIPFLALIDLKGNFVGFQDTREGQGKKLQSKQFLVPALGEKKGNGIKANLLWENIEYLFGIPVPTPNKPTPDTERVRMQHQAFVDRIIYLRGDCICLQAVRVFLQSNQPDQLQRDGLWQEVFKLNQPLLLALQGFGPVTDDPAIREIVNASQVAKGANGYCLVTGEEDEIVALEASISGVRGANSMGACLVGFQRNSGLDSFGKEQGGNAPIGKRASFAYTTALNHLLGKGSQQKLQVGDATTVFWSAKSDLFEEQVGDFFAEPSKDNPDRLTEAVRSLYRSAETGAYATDDDDTCFYVLGLSPNAARLAVRFWKVGTVAEMAGHFRQHFDDTEIIHGPNERPYLPIKRLLQAVALLGDAEKIPPNLAGDTMRAVLGGLPYPATLFQAVVRRVRAEQAATNKTTGRPVPNITYERAALIKACLNRQGRFQSSATKEELTVSLDPANCNVGYRLGRLFAVLERIQERANPGINATIRDRFYGAASGTPAAVFGTLMRLKNHHLAKLEHTGERVNFEKLLGEVVDGIGDFPPHLPLADQGRFAIGYYHQKQQFFSKKDASTETSETLLQPVEQPELSLV